MVANGNKHQLNILPSCKINMFSLLRIGGIHRHKITSHLILLAYLKQQKKEIYKYLINKYSLFIIINFKIYKRPS